MGHGRRGLTKLLSVAGVTKLDTDSLKKINEAFTAVPAEPVLKDATPEALSEARTMTSADNIRRLEQLYELARAQAEGQKAPKGEAKAASSKS
jgi:hypothetical protein